MHDFGEFCYLDLQKTGSSFVSDFLRRHVRLPELHFRKHKPYRPRKLGGGDRGLMFISVRDPLDQYLSLYFHGVGGKGGLRNRLGRTLPDHASGLYSGSPAAFEDWVRFVLAPENAMYIGADYEKAPARIIGLQTFRFVRLAVRRPDRNLARIGRREDLNLVYETASLPFVVLRTESLNCDLAQLCRGRLAPFLIEPELAVRELLEGGTPVNASDRPDREQRLAISDDVRRLVQDREWFLLERFGYGPYHC
ncbi:hypothetical protein [Microbaculum marinum]|uniref:Sulfotransferase family protein n=1 Tax=Microbaculum marinum TaxID=1764581 RepID=A0AAW9RLF3_9HYPH